MGEKSPKVCISFYFLAFPFPPEHSRALLHGENSCVGLLSIYRYSLSFLIAFGFHSLPSLIPQKSNISDHNISLPNTDDKLKQMQLC